MSGPFKKDWVHWMLGGSGSVPAALLLSPSRSLSLSLSLFSIRSTRPVLLASPLVAIVASTISFAY